MSRTASHIIGLVKSLPLAEQHEIREVLDLSVGRARAAKQRELQRLPDGSFFNPEGMPNDDPVFKILDEVEAERHRTPGPPPPRFD